jgi:putative oxidoreductase
MIPETLHGLGNTEAALTLGRVTAGLFFSISGYHKIFNKERHKALLQTLEADHIPLVKVNQWWVPSVEFTAGAALTLGLMPVISAVLLVVICIVATCTDGLKRIWEWKPIDWADWLDDLLYLPETLYCVLLLMVVIAGPGYVFV